MARLAAFAVLALANGDGGHVWGLRDSNAAGEGAVMDAADMRSGEGTDGGDKGEKKKEELGGGHGKEWLGSGKGGAGVYNTQGMVKARLEARRTLKLIVLVSVWLRNNHYTSDPGTRSRRVHFHQARTRRVCETLSNRIYLAEQQRTLQPARLRRDLEQPRHVLLGQRRQSLRNSRLVLLFPLGNIAIRLGPFPSDLSCQIRHVPLFSPVRIHGLHDLLQVPRHTRRL